MTAAVVWGGQRSDGGVRDGCVGRDIRDGTASGGKSAAALRQWGPGTRPQQSSDPTQGPGGRCQRRYQRWPDDRISDICTLRQWDQDRDGLLSREELVSPSSGLVAYVRAAMARDPQARALPPAPRRAVRGAACKPATRDAGLGARGAASIPARKAHPDPW
jgi:hypothetical protein